MKDQKIKVGDVFYKDINHKNRVAEIEKVVVGKVGSKYFYLNGYDGRYPFDKKTLLYHERIYGTRIQLYKDKQEIIDKTEKIQLLDKLQKHFNYSGNGSRNSLDELRKAASALGLLP